MPVITADILHDEPINPGGIRSVIYWQEVRNVDNSVFPYIDYPSVTDFGAAHEISTDIVLKDAQKFYKLYGTETESNVESEIVGEMDGKSPRVSLTLFHPGNKIFGFVNAMPNANFIFLVPSNKGELLIVGTPDNPAKLMEGSGGSGQGLEGRRGHSLTFQANHGPIIYSGSVDEDDTV